jgi:hypothetical protein
MAGWSYRMPGVEIGSPREPLICDLAYLIASR